MADHQWSFADDSAGKGWGFADEPSLGAKALNATGQFFRGLVPDTIKGMVGMAKEIAPHPDLTGSEAKEAKDMIDQGDYLGAAKRILSSAFQSVPGGKFITDAVHNTIDEAGKAKEAWDKGDIATAANRASRAIPVAGPLIGGLADVGAGTPEERDAEGNVTQAATPANPARMVGQIAGLALAPKVIESAAPAAMAGTRAAIEAAKAGGGDVAAGAAKATAGGVVSMIPHNPIVGALGGYEIAKSGLKQMGRGMAAGYEALKQSIAESKAPVSSVAERVPIWKDLPASSEEKFGPVQTPSERPQLPSGRRPPRFSAPEQSAAAPQQVEAPAQSGAPQSQFEGAYPIPPEERTGGAMAAPKESYQRAARTVKARALARWLRIGGIPLEDAQGMTAEQWGMAAEGAGVNVPSPDSVKLALSELEKLYTGKGAVQIDEALKQGNRGKLEFYLKKAADDKLPADAREDQPGEGSVRETQAGSAVQESLGGAPSATPQETSVLIPGSAKELPARYALRELSDIQASHNGVTFQPNPKYGLTNDRDYSVRDNQGKVISGAAQLNPRLLITDNPDATNGPPVIHGNDVMGGNSRAMILQRAYVGNLEGAAAYRSLLEQKAAQFGLDPEQVKAMKQPVLVRELSDDAVTNQGQAQAAVTDLNKTSTAALRPAERAIADSRRVSQATLDDIAGRLEAHGPDATLANVLEGKSGAEVLNKMIDDGVISPQERAGLASGDSLTPEGKARISKLMLGRFFRDPAQLDRIPHAIVKKLERVAAPLAKVENSGWSLTPRVQEALDLIEEAKSHNAKNLDVFLKQDGLLGDQRYSPEAVEMAKTLQKTPTAKLTEMVRRYAEDAQFASGGQNLFGNAPTPKQSFQEAFGQ